MKKIASSILALLLTFSVVACSTPNDGGTTSIETKGSTNTAANVDLFDPANYKSSKAESEWTIGVVVKDNASAWFARLNEGLKEFKEETGINVIMKGPATPDAASQLQVVEDMIAQGVDALCVVPLDPSALEASLEKAMKQGIVVVTHEASNQKNTLFDIEAFTADDFGAALMDALAGEMDEEGKYAMMVAYTTSTTHMEYANAEKARQLAAYPNMELINNGAVPTVESEESVDTAYERAKEVIKVNPDLKGFTGIASTDILGIARAVEELGLSGKVEIVGMGTPNEAKEFVENGTISKIMLWDPKDSGYAMCDVAAKILRGEEVGNGANLNVVGYEDVTEVVGTNRCLIGQAQIEIDVNNINEYDF